MSDKKDFEIVAPALWWGHVEIESRLRREGDTLIGEGRRIHYQDGKVVHDTGWRSTGVSLSNVPEETALGYVGGQEPSWWKAFIKDLLKWKPFG
jgi:hypothetical protein